MGGFWGLFILNMEEENHKELFMKMGKALRTNFLALNRRTGGSSPVTEPIELSVRERRLEENMADSNYQEVTESTDNCFCFFKNLP